MFVNYLEPHLQYDPPDRFIDRSRLDGVDASAVDDVNQDAWSYICGIEEMDERDFEVLTSLYEGELAYLDHRLGEVYDYLDSLGLLDETAVFLVGDHGENIGDHGLMDHQYCLYDTLIHVPLVVRYPGAFDRGVCYDGLVELRDLYPTILDLAGIDVPKGDGVSTNSLREDPARDHVVGEYLIPQPPISALEDRVEDVPDSVRRYDRGLVCIRTRNWKYVRGTDGSEELYDLGEDPAETMNKARERRDVCAKLASALEADRRWTRRPDVDSGADLDETAKRRLDDLGYIP